MSKYNYEGPEKYRPLSPWGYFGYSLLFCIPIIGWIFWIVFAFSGKNINRRNYARSFFCHFLFGLLICMVVALIIHFNIALIRERLSNWKMPTTDEIVIIIDRWFPASGNLSDYTVTPPNTEGTATEQIAPEEETAAISVSSTDHE